MNARNPFVWLTSAGTGLKFLVNAASIVYVQEVVDAQGDKTITCVNFSNRDYIYVKETVSDLDDLITQIARENRPQEKGEGI